MNSGFDFAVQESKAGSVDGFAGPFFAEMRAPPSGVEVSPLLQIKSVLAVADHSQGEAECRSFDIARRVLAGIACLGMSSAR